jgi:hypothetical protein
MATPADAATTWTVFPGEAAWKALAKAPPFSLVSAP